VPAAQLAVCVVHAVEMAVAKVDGVVLDEKVPETHTEHTRS
jgi:hypothetical protein